MAPIAPDPSAQLRLIRAVRDEGFDVLHLHEPLVPGRVHDRLPAQADPAGRHVPRRRHRARPTSTSRRRCAGWPAASTCGWWCRPRPRRWPVDHLGGTYEHLFNGIEIDRFAKAEPWPTDGPTIFFLGRHEPRKGLDVLLAALPLLPADVTVWVGSRRPRHRAAPGPPRRRPAAVWLGRLTDEEKRRRLRAADVFCAPSLRGESFGVVLLEAMAAEAAIVASDLSGYRLVARPDQDGLLVPPGDAEALGRRARPGARRPGPPRPTGGLGHRAGHARSRWTSWPTATSSSTSGSAPPAPQAEGWRRRRPRGLTASIGTPGSRLAVALRWTR